MPQPTSDESHELALRSANAAFSRRERDVHRQLLAPEVRFADRRTSAWELAATGAVGLLALLVVLALLFR
ncbi:MAG: hypothetical protein IT376_03900 [Polyangiaceae bacterium]|nr:hypothetical protein [Polyangiaceae bacterium]